MIVVLLGYMASGKSTIGKILADKLNYDFFDLDDFIEQHENNTVSEIFNSKGEIYFRKIEGEYLKTLLDTKRNLVLSLGGGTPCYGNNMQNINQHTNCVSIYLKASISTLVNRLTQQKTSRPLVAHLNSEEKLTEFIGKHLFEREVFYRKATHIINIDRKTQQDLLEDIIFDLL